MGLIIFQKKFQSTLPRGERLTSVKDTYRSAYISIHAPARGATKDGNPLAQEIEISIHAPARGATSLMISGIRPENGFQSTLPRGERHCVWVILYSWRKISIHAPARGATQKGHIFRARDRNFNPRSREGSDLLVTNMLLYNHNFNPRSREGSDVKIIFGCSCPIQFQSTLPRGERLYSSLHARIDQGNISIHAPARGATVTILYPVPAPFHFNPRSREGSD